MSGGDDRREWAWALAESLATPEGLRQARRLQAEGRLAELLLVRGNERDQGAAGSSPPGGDGGARLRAIAPGAGGTEGAESDDADGAVAPPARRRPEPIGVWQPVESAEGLTFVRPEPHPLGDHSANVRVLRPKRAPLPLRVVLFGESAAAGYLYAPHLTPARVLESQLQSRGGAESFEVVDLARTNERLPTLARTVRAALQIQPDVLVVYAGNNWNLLETPEVSPYAASVAARLDYAKAWREGGLEGAIRLAEERLRGCAEIHLDLIALIASTVQIPVVLVIPEVNLADWETRQPPPWLPGDGLARWYGDLEVALERLRAADWSAVRARAEAMIARDGGRCATSWRLLARALEGQGAAEPAGETSAVHAGAAPESSAANSAGAAPTAATPQAAADAAQREIDAAPYATLGFLSAPQVSSFARRILRDKAAEHGWLTVDLRAVFAGATGSPLPGRELFLDYCHLSSKGMEIAMAAVAAEVLEISGLVATEDLREPVPLTVPPAVEATARLGAALHTAHRHLPVGPKGPLLEHWLESALAVDPGVGEAMLDLLRMRTSPLPAILTEAQQRNFASPYRLLLQHGLRWEQLDADLLLALVAVLERHGVPALAEMNERLIAGFRMIAGGAGGTDLSEAPFLWEPLERFFPDVMEFDDLPPRGYLRAPWPESSFCLIADGVSTLEVEANVRLPPVPGVGTTRSGEVEVRVNGELRGAFAASEQWTRAGLRFEGATLNPGLNRLTLRWPMPPPLPAEAAAAPLRAALERLEIGVSADLHPVFGEVYSLVARLG